MSLARELIVTTPPIRSTHVVWGSIIAGTCVAIATTVLLAELAAGMGFQAMRPISEHVDAHAVASLATAGVVAWIVSGMIALFFGGWVAAHIARRSRATESTLQGVLVWAFSTVLLVIAATTAIGGMIGGGVELAGSATHGAGAAIGGLATGAGSAVGAAAPAFHWDSIKAQAEDLFGSSANSEQQPVDGNRDATGAPAQPAAQTSTGATAADPARAAAGANPPASQLPAGQSGAASGTTATQQNTSTVAASEPTAGSVGQDNAQAPAASMGPRAASELVQRLFSTPDAVRSDADMQQLQNILVERGKVTPAQAQQIIQQWQRDAAQAKQVLEDAKAQAKVAADKAAKAASWAAFVAFAATLLGLAAAAIGGHLGGHTAGTHEEDEKVMSNTSAMGSFTAADQHDAGKPSGGPAHA